MYLSPIDLRELSSIELECPPLESVVEELAKRTAQSVDNEIMIAVKKVGITVDKDELIKALQYDRGQYEKGYQDGYAVTRAEIERLKGDILDVTATLSELETRSKQIKAEAIKEFAERLKEQPIKCEFPFFGLRTDDEIAEHFNSIMKQVSEAIDNLVKEMVGERKEG